MKRMLITAIIVLVVSTSACFGKEEKAAAEPAVPTKQELVWEKKYLEERYNALEAGIKLNQVEMQQIVNRFVDVEKALNKIAEEEKKAKKKK